MLRRLLLFMAVMVAVLVVDQGSKFWAVDELTTLFRTPPPKSFETKVRYFVQATHLSGDQAPVPHADLRLPPRPMLQGLVALHYEENPGAAGGLLGRLPEWLRVPLFHAVGVVAVAAMVLLTLRLPPERRAARLGAALLGGGALSNGVDRWLHGYVVDFLIYRWYPGARGPTFNLADVAICAGVGLLLLESLFQRRPGKTGPKRP